MLCPRLNRHLGRRENSTAPSPGGGPGGESCVSFYFVPPLVQGPAVPTYSKKEQFPFPPGSQVHGTTVCDALLPHSRQRPFFRQQPKEYGSGTMYLPTHLWPVPYGTQGIRWGCLRMHRLLYHPPLLPFAAPPPECRLCCWSRLHSVWRRGSRCPACLAGSRTQFDSATRFSSPGDLPSSTAFSRHRWQSRTLVAVGSHRRCMTPEDAWLE